MRINKINTAKTNFSGALNNKGLLKTLEFASNNGALFAVGTAAILSTFVRPFAILATPKTRKESKEYACAKSIASSIIGLGIVALITTPIVKAVNNIQKNPNKFLTKESIKNFKTGAKNLANSKTFAFSSQMIKLSSSFLTILIQGITPRLLSSSSILITSKTSTVLTSAYPFLVKDSLSILSVKI